MHAPRDRVPLEDVLRLAEAVLFPCVEGALAKAGVAARDVDVLVVNCSAFAPFPSLSGGLCSGGRDGRAAAGCCVACNRAPMLAGLHPWPCQGCRALPTPSSCPSPALCRPAAMIVNHFRMRADVASYNLSGMGCSAGVIAVGLAADALQVRGARRPAFPGSRRTH